MDVPLFRGTFIIILSNSPNKIRKHLPKWNDSEVYGHSWLSDFKGNQGFYVILNYDSKHRPIYHGVIAHESHHIASFIAECRGIQPDFNNDEPCAYLAEWASDEIYKFSKSKGFKPVTK